MAAEYTNPSENQIDPSDGRQVLAFVREQLNDLSHRVDTMGRRVDNLLEYTNSRVDHIRRQVNNTLLWMVGLLLGQWTTVIIYILTHRG